MKKLNHIHTLLLKKTHDTRYLKPHDRITRGSLSDTLLGPCEPIKPKILDFCGLKSNNIYTKWT